MAGRMRKFVKEEVITLAYILLYIALSSGQIFFNKKNYLVLQLGKVYIQNSPFGMPRKLNQYQKAYMIVVQSGGLSDFWAARDWVVSIAVFIIGVAAGLEVMSCRMLFTIALCLFIPWIFLEKPKMDAEAIAGVGAYNNHKLKKEASRGTSNESQHSESVPLVSSSTSEKYIN